MWLPAVVCIFMGGVWWASAWAVWAGGFWSHMQGAVSGIAAILKEDIYKAVMSLLFCREYEESKDTHHVAVQSISAVLDNGPDDVKKKAEKIGRHSWGRSELELPDPEQGLPLSPVKSGGKGDPNAHWPSQRPMRVNPRLQRLQQVQEEASGISSAESCTTTSPPPTTDKMQSSRTTTSTASSSSSSARRPSVSASSKRPPLNTSQSIARLLLLALDDDSKTFDSTNDNERE